MLHYFSLIVCYLLATITMFSQPEPPMVFRDPTTGAITNTTAPQNAIPYYSDEFMKRAVWHKNMELVSAYNVSNGTENIQFHKVSYGTNSSI